MFRKIVNLNSLKFAVTATTKEGIYRPVQNILIAHMGTMGSQKKKKAMKIQRSVQIPKEAPRDAEVRSVEDIATSIDTTLTPDQHAYALEMRKKFYGNSSVRCKCIYISRVEVSIEMLSCCYLALYRDVPTPDEIVGTGNFLPLIAPNAEALINFALSQIPKSMYIDFAKFHCIFKLIV